MKLGIISDLHMEFSPYELTKENDVTYIVAGDIHSNTNLRDHWLNINEIDFHVLGNHDWYDGERDFKNAPYDFRSKLINGLTLAGATLWTDLSKPMDWLYYLNGLIDKRYIKGMDQDIYNHTHNMHKEFLMDSKADIWVTHHCVSYMSVSEKYRGNPYNASFTTELSDDILSLSKPPKLIIHGHTHDEFDYMIGETRVICHPRGYPGENSWFKTYKPKIVEI